MLVCAHGDVVDYCDEHSMVICDTWAGKLNEYRGPVRVLVTDSDVSENEYYFLKGELLARGIELISTRHKDNQKLSEYLVYANGRRKTRYHGRPRIADEAVIQRIRELRDKGMTIREIRLADGVCRPDGSRFGISTIHKYIKDKEEK